MEKILKLKITITNYEKSKKLENDLQTLTNKRLTNNEDINNLWKLEGFFGFELRDEGKFLLQIKELKGFYSVREIFDIIWGYYNLDLKEIDSAHYINKNKLVLFRESNKNLFKNYFYIINKDGTVNNNYDYSLNKICEKYFERNEEKDTHPISIREFLKQITESCKNSPKESLLEVDPWHRKDLVPIILEKYLERDEIKLIERRVYNKKQIKSFLKGVV